jgi:two-component SAPR family response regulator
METDMEKINVILRDTDSTSNILLDFLLNSDERIKCEKCDTHEILMSNLIHNNYDFLLFNPGLFYDLYLDFIKKCKTDYPDMKIIILNSFIINGDKSEFIMNGADFIIPKTFQIDTLIKLLTERVDKKFLIRNRILNYHYQHYSA